VDKKLVGTHPNLNILSVCTNYPTANYPTVGLFVQRRLAAMSGLADLQVLVPQPSFPVLRPKRTDSLREFNNLRVTKRSMFYIPKIANHWNGMWMDRCIEQWLESLPSVILRNAVLDAHFGFPEGVGAFRVAKRRKLPFFITLRGVETDLFQVPAIRRQLIDALNQATGVIAVSESLRNTAVENGVDSSKIRVIGNGVDGSFFSLGSKSHSRTNLGIPASDKLIVSVGTIRRLKGFDLLLEAIKPFRDDLDFRCVILGKVMEQSFFNELNESIASMGMESRIQILGARPPEEVVHWLRAADMFVLPTRREGCCNAVLEALSTGVPVITTPAGDNVKFVSNGFSGFIVAHESPHEITNAISRSWHHPWDPKAISESVRAHTWEGAAWKVIDYFHERLHGVEVSRDRN
jgi:glycosyltransferase involved in cell wall biosynthesis